MSEPFIIFPAIDLRQGQVVRLKEGDPLRQTHYSSQPGEMAQRWLDDGSDWLHVVNLDGAFGDTGQTNQAALLQIIKVTQKAGARVQFGGGLRDLQSVDMALESGVERAIIGTLAVENPDLFRTILAKWGPDRIGVSLDARDGIVHLHGWSEPGGIKVVGVHRHRPRWTANRLQLAGDQRPGICKRVERHCLRRRAQRGRCYFSQTGCACRNYHWARSV